jgi:hypothetical protein
MKIFILAFCLEPIENENNNSVILQPPGSDLSELQSGLPTNLLITLVVIFGALVLGVLIFLFVFCFYRYSFVMNVVLLPLIFKWKYLSVWHVGNVQKEQKTKITRPRVDNIKNSLAIFKNAWWKFDLTDWRMDTSIEFHVIWSLYFIHNNFWMNFHSLFNQLFFL